MSLPLEKVEDTFSEEYFYPFCCLVLCFGKFYLLSVGGPR